MQETETIDRGEGGRESDGGGGGEKAYLQVLFFKPPQQNTSSSCCRHFTGAPFDDGGRSEDPRAFGRSLQRAHLDLTCHLTLSLHISEHREHGNMYTANRPTSQSESA